MTGEELQAKINRAHARYADSGDVQDVEIPAGVMVVPSVLDLREGVRLVPATPVTPC